ncbi:uncharacterized protein LOC127838232 [Dreissena polymorpha]|uniref:uncharacterized protein LOC127838232 n=1 Tax=Dreissena polymorpha TaxID=45954 RepID=UPI00226526CA|nr:uncharacterized protein LOC127838232 [Dreissena polymorpha]
MPAGRARPSIGKVVLKWLCSVFLGIVLLACVIETKLGILNISNKMRETSERRFVRFIMLFLVVLVPSVVNLLRGIWRGALRHNMPWPRKPAFLWGLVVSLLEALGLCLFVFHIPGIKGIDQPCKVILIMNGVHLCPAVYNAWQAVKTKESIVRNTFATIVMVAFGVISFWLVQENIGQFMLSRKFKLGSHSTVIAHTSLAITPIH